MIPQLKIISPVEGQIILGNRITVSFIVGNLEIGREGYLQLFLDSDNEKSTPSAILTTHFDYSIEGLSPGGHRLTLEVVKKDDKSFDPKVFQSVEFQTLLPTTVFPTTTVQAKGSPDYFLSKTFIGAILGLVIVSTGLFIGLRNKKQIL